MTDIVEMPIKFIEVRNLIEEYISNVDNEYIIDLYNHDISDDHVGTMDEFEDHFRCESKLDVIDRLDGDFDASGEYFKDSCLIESSDDLFDLIDEGEVIRQLEGALEAVDDKYSMPNGFEDLYDEYIDLLKPKHTDAEIAVKTREFISGMDDDDIIMLVTYEGLPPIFPMSEFTTYVSGLEITDVVSKLVRSMITFSFAQAFFGSDADFNFYISYTRFAVENLVYENISKIKESDLKEEFPSLYEIRNGNW